MIQTCQIFQKRVCSLKWSRSRYNQVQRPRTNCCATSRYELGHKMLNQILELLLYWGLILFTWSWKLMCFFLLFYLINCDLVCFRPLIATLIRICEYPQKSIWISFLNKPRTSMFKYHNKPGFAMKIVWHSTSKQKEFKEKVIQTCKIFQLKVCYSKWSRSRYFKVERPRTKRCTTGQYEIGHKMLNQILGLLLFLGLILFTWFWKLMCFFFFSIQ